MIVNLPDQPSVRVRFAPSPTGHLHIGGLRAALFNWLFARHVGGKFLLRIEDTDLERSRPEYTQSIIDSLAWCSLESDEPLVYQSDRRQEHVAVAHELVAKGAAYRCYCTSEELQARLGASAAEGGYLHYDGKCREMVTLLDKPYVIRYKVLQDRESVAVHDLIRGTILFPLKTIDDFIIVRSDGSPMFNFVVVLDDAFMRISHVIRGEEHLVNTPRQILLYEACGYALPQFAHVPLILAPNGSKLSKRDGATAATDYKKLGYLPDALCNYLVRLGWAHGDQEVFTRDEMISLFSLAGVHKSGAIFDMAKLLWMNHVYMKQASAQQLLSYISDTIDNQFLSSVRKWSDTISSPDGRTILQLVIDIYKDRAKTLIELRDDLLRLYARPNIENDPFIATMNSMQWEALALLVKYLAELDYTRSALELLIKQICKEATIRLPDIAQPIRLALTGSLSAPGVYDLLFALGRDESLARLSILLALRP